MFRDALKRYAQVDIRPRADDPLKFDFFVRKYKFATLTLVASFDADGRSAVYRTTSKEYVVRRREDGFDYVEIEGHRALRLLLDGGGERGACELTGARYRFREEPGEDGPRLVARRDGKVYALGFHAPTAEGVRAVAVGNAMIESPDLHPLLAVLAWHVTARDRRTV